MRDDEVFDAEVRTLSLYDPARLRAWPLSPLKRSNVSAHVLLSLIMTTIASALILAEFAGPPSSHLGVSGAAICATIGYHYLQEACRERYFRRTHSMIVQLEPESDQYPAQLDRVIKEAPRPDYKSRIFSYVVFSITLIISFAIIFLSIPGYGWRAGWFATALSGFNVLRGYLDLRAQTANRPPCLEAFVNFTGIDQNGNA